MQIKIIIHSFLEYMPQTRALPKNFKYENINVHQNILCMIE